MRLLIRLRSNPISLEVVISGLSVSTGLTLLFAMLPPGFTLKYSLVINGSGSIPVFAIEALNLRKLIADGIVTISDITAVKPNDPKGYDQLSGGRVDDQSFLPDADNTSQFLYPISAPTYKDCLSLFQISSSADNL